MDSAAMREETRELYLSVGEAAVHTGHPERGRGRVVEEMNSVVPGGMSFIRIDFRCAGMRTFDNNLESLQCCYHAGVRRAG